ncbi:MAG: HAMP domain-containing sensor histidine kinase [Myxococcota bacterium]
MKQLDGILRVLRPRSMRLRLFLTVLFAACIPLLIAARVEEDRALVLRQAAVVLPVALLLASWLAWRVIRPLEALRAQALEQAPRPVAHPNLRLARDDEFGDLANALNALLAALQERQKQNEAFVADLAHEMKNPVAAIRACAESLGQGAVDAERAARLAGIIDDSSRRLDVIITQFLELARAEAGMPNEARSPVDLTALAGGILEGARARHAAVRFELDAPGPLLVSGVPVRLESVIRNLVDNAVSYAGEAGWVRVALCRNGQSMILRVSDSGPGIPVENLSRIFERFFTTRSSGRGSGLGLALVKAIVEAHGGRVDVESPPGQGATFQVVLPAG